MILLWGLAGDEPLDEVARELAARGTLFAHLDQRAVLNSRVDLVGSGVAGVLVTPTIDVSLADVAGLLVRNYDARQLSNVKQAGAAGLAHVEAVESALWCFADLAPIRVLNRPSAMQSNNSKPYQARIIRAHGFEIPDTVITTDPEVALAFWQRHRSVIYKSISGQRSIVSRLASEHLERLADIRWCPTQLQEHVAGCDYRVHVIGDAVVATQVISGADDYRYATRKGSSVELRACEVPADIAERCVALATGLQLPLAGIDLRRAIDGRWFCFEVNPSPCFTYYDQRTDQGIAARVAAFLAHQ